MTAIALALVLCGQAPPVFYADEAPAVFAPDDGAPYSKIVVYTEPWCGPCQRWKKECKPSLLAAGWTIETKGGQGKSIPRFEVHIGDYVSKFSGYASKESFYAKVNAAIAEATGKSPAQKVVRGYGSGGWTWPGGPSVSALERHLASPPHNYSLEKLRSMSDKELIQLHDDWHNRSRAPRRVRLRAG